jgi:hypothetical protein
MSVLVRFGKHKAILREGLWLSANRALESLLNQETSGWIRETGGPSLSDRDQERAVAAELADRLGGRITLHVRAQCDEATAPYIQHRQLRFEFNSFVPGNSRRR